MQKIGFRRAKRSWAEIFSGLVPRKPGSWPGYLRRFSSAIRFCVREQPTGYGKRRESAETLRQDERGNMGRRDTGKGIRQRARDGDGWIRERGGRGEPIGRSDPGRNHPGCILGLAMT